jgi:polar amino acid transport system substrate-binding protein
VLFQVRSASAQAAQEFRWGGDAEGGAPFVEADPPIPLGSGLDVDIAGLIAGLGARRFPGQVHQPRRIGGAGDFRRPSASKTARRVRCGWPSRSRITSFARFHSAAPIDRFQLADCVAGGSPRSAPLAYDLLVAAQPRDGVVPSPTKTMCIRNDPRWGVAPLCR